MSYPAFPDRVYIDTSYLINLVSYARNPKDKDFKKCKALYDHLLKSNIGMIASPLTLEEAIFYLFFKRQLLTQARTFGFSSTKRFRKSRKKDFSSCYRAHSGIPKKILTESRTLGIEYAFPRYSLLGINASKRVNQYAAKMLRKYTELDSKDAFHVAIARCLRIEYIISCDNDFSSLQEIRHYNPI